MKQIFEWPKANPKQCGRDYLTGNLERPCPLIPESKQAIEQTLVCTPCKCTWKVKASAS